MPLGWGDGVWGSLELQCTSPARDRLLRKSGDVVN
jgi:hypothetical protein